MPRSNNNLVKGAVPMIVENADETAPTYIEATEENYIMQQQCVSTVSVPLQERIQADTQVEENAIECQELLECSNENQIEEQNETNKQKSPEKVVAEECTINLIDIEDYLENIALRQTWCWIKKLHCIVLIQIDSRTLQIRCLLKIHSDLSVTIHTYDDKVTVHLCTLESTTKIEQMLNNVEYNTIVCSGTGIMNKSRANNCTGFMPREDCKRIVKEPRCDECIRHRINLRRQSKTNLKIRFLIATHPCALCSQSTYIYCFLSSPPPIAALWWRS